MLVLPHFTWIMLPEELSAQQVKAGMAYHLAFDELETIELVFSLSITSKDGESGADRAA